MKVFCIGLNKTATRSLHDALEILGLRGMHWGGPANRAAVERALEEGRPLLHYLEEADAYADILALSTNFDVLDRQYPGSKFILTVRELDDWLDSRRRHVETNRARRDRGEYTGTFVVVDPAGWTAEAAEHEKSVRSHFAGRPDDLLIMDIPGGDGWAQLCPFLGTDVPDEPFPKRG